MENLNGGVRVFKLWGVGDCKIDKSLGGLSEFSPCIYV